MTAYATVQDIIDLYGPLTADEQSRAGALLPLVSNALRFEAEKVGRNLDFMIENDANLGDVAKLVTVDIVKRVLRQSMEGEPMTQEAESALGYSWSGKYAIPGGGIAQAIMKNDLKRLGIRVQRYGGIEPYGSYKRKPGHDLY